MPSFNFTIPDSSPLILYGGSWSDTPKTDTDWQQYVNDTYHITSQAGATATLNFNGSAIYIYGAKKPNYDSFDVTLDGGSPATVSAAAGGKEFNTLLYSATSLDITKPHTLVVRNDGSSSTQGSSMDIDYMVITAGDGNAQTSSQDVYWDQDIGGDKIAFSSDWATGTNVNYSDGTAAITYAQNAWASVTFEGNAIALYGTINTDHAMFSVSIDDGTQFDFNGFAPEPRFQMLLYYANGLPQGQHVLKLTDITADPAGQRQNGLEFDGALIQTWPEATNATSTASGTDTGSSSPTHSITGPPGADNTNPPPTQHKSISTGAIVGVAVAAVAFVVVLALALLMLYRHRRRSRELSDRQNVLLQAEDYVPDPFVTPPVPSAGFPTLHAGESGTFNESSVLISPVATSVAPSHTYTRPSMSQVSPVPVLSSSAAAHQQAQTSSSMSEKQRLMVLHGDLDALPPTVTNATSSGAAGTTASSSQFTSNANPHGQDFPPPDYQHVFPSPTSASHSS